MKAGAEIPFKRAENLSGDYISEVAVIRDCINYLNET